MKLQTPRLQWGQALLHTSKAKKFPYKPCRRMQFQSPKDHQKISTRRSSWRVVGQEQTGSPCDTFRNQQQTPSGTNKAPGPQPNARPCCRNANAETDSAAKTSASAKPEEEAEAEAQDAISSLLLSTPTWSVRSLLPPTRAPTTSTSSSSSLPPTGNDITSQTLRHMLRLSSLPYPSPRPSSQPATTTTTTTPSSPSPSPEASALQTLQAQLHFLRAIQSILPLTQQTKPLVSIRDETSAGVAENSTVTLADLRPALDAEVVVGRVNRRRRRVRSSAAAAAASEAGKPPPPLPPGRIGGGSAAGMTARTGTGRGKGETTAVDADNCAWNPLATASKTASGGMYFLVDSGGLKGGGD